MPHGPLVLALDAGTTGVTCLALDGDRRVAARAYKELGQSYPKPGWVEQDAGEILAACTWALKVAARNGARKLGHLRSPKVAAIGIANQRETVVLWDKASGNPVAPAIVWQDRRTSARCQSLRPEWETLVRKRTGLVLDPYFSATKLEWLLKDPDLKARARRGELRAGTIDAWLSFRLTGHHATDATNASRTLLFDIHKGRWDAQLLDLFGIPEALLPDVVPSAHEVGSTSLLGDAPLAALVGDQQAALFGQGCMTPGSAKATYGTGAFLLQHTGTEARRSRHGLLTTRAASHDGGAQFALEGAVFSAGSAIQWLRDQLGLFRKAPDVNRLAGSVEDNGGVYLVPGFTGLGAPHWDPEARAAVVGLSRGSHKGHLARAALEAIALQCADVLDAMEKDSGHAIPELRVDGGASQSALVLQAQADALRRPVVRPANIETTAMGAGMLAGLAVGAWRLDDLVGGSEDATVVHPRMPAAAVTAWRSRWSDAVAAARSFRPPA